jgi:hypothetical protein
VDGALGAPHDLDPLDVVGKEARQVVGARGGARVVELDPVHEDDRVLGS